MGKLLRLSGEMIGPTVMDLYAYHAHPERAAASPLGRQFMRGSARSRLRCAEAARQAGFDPPGVLTVHLLISVQGRAANLCDAPDLQR
jgi:hypothetical protein